MPDPNQPEDGEEYEQEEKADRGVTEPLMRWVFVGAVQQQRQISDQRAETRQRSGEPPTAPRLSIHGEHENDCGQGQHRSVPHTDPGLVQKRPLRGRAEGIRIDVCRS